MMTDADAPRHRNLGYFIIPVPAEGLEVKEMALLPGHDQHAIFMDNVRVPGDHLIGGETQGWQVMGAHLEQEHGGRGRAVPRDELVDDLVSYAKETKLGGGTLGSDPLVQQTAMEAVIDAHRDDLLARRTYWMYQSRMEINFQGNMSNVHGRESSLRNARRIRGGYGHERLHRSQGARRTQRRRAGSEPAHQGRTEPRRRQHEHREGHPVPANRHQPDAGAGCPHAFHCHRPRQLGATARHG